MAAPNYEAATAGSGNPPLAQQINQFLGLHAISYLFAGVKQNSQETDGSAAIGISGTPPGGGFTRLAQSFVIPTVAGGTAVGYLGLFGKKVGSGCDLTLELFNSSASKPNTQVGTTSVTIPADFWTTSNGWLYAPLPITGLTASTTYFAVLIAGDVNGNNPGNATNYISLEKSNQVSGACTYAASTWSTAAYGFMFREYDQTVSGNLTFIWEDAGGRYTYFGYDGSNNMTAVNEYTIAQGTGQMRSVRAVTMSGDIPVSVA